MNEMLVENGLNFEPINFIKVLMLIAGKILIMDKAQSGYFRIKAIPQWVFFKKDNLENGQSVGKT